MKNLTNQEIARKVRAAMKAEAASLSYLADYFPEEQVAAVANLLANHKGSVFTTACGTSGVTARKIAHTMSCIEIPCTFIAPSDAIHGGLGRVREGDIVIFISKGGQSGELLPIMDACKAKKAVTIVTTEKPEGTLARQADYRLPMNIDREADSFGMLATSSTLAAMSIWDGIIITLVEMTGYTQERFKVIHSGGAVGRQLDKF